MKEISAASHARIYIYRVQDKPNSLLVRGVYHEIEEVRSLLKQIAVQEDVMEKQIAHSVANRYLRPTSKLSQLVQDAENIQVC